MRLAAAEQAGEQLGEMAVDPLERRRQPLPHFVVECRNAAAQPRDRLGQLGALALQLGDPRLDLGGLALGHQIDRAHAVALADQAVQPRRGLGRIGGASPSLSSGEFAESVGCDTQPLADIASEARQGFRCAVPQPSSRARRSRASAKA